MTRNGYRLLLGLLALLLVGGGIAAAPTRVELGLVPSMSCEEWWPQRDSTGPVRVEGCVVDAAVYSYTARLDDRGLQDALVQVRPAGWQATEQTVTERAEVVWLTTDPEILSLVDRGRRAPDDDAHDRFVQRYDAELLRARPIVGTVSTDRFELDWSELIDLQGENVTERPVIIDGRPRSPESRAVGVVLITLALLGIALLVPLQRRWDRRRATLTGRAGPLRF